MYHRFPSFQGEKAQRHYEEAARLYGLALHFSGISEEEKYDAGYNLYVQRTGSSFAGGRNLKLKV